MNNAYESAQRSVCQRFGAAFQPCDMSFKVGISKSVRTGELPIHGLRIREENGTSGWYIWTGTRSDDDDFFLPLHGEHLVNWCPAVIPYLALPSGWRFLIGENHEDVWNDPGILLP